MLATAPRRPAWRARSAPGRISVVRDSSPGVFQSRQTGPAPGTAAAGGLGGGFGQANVQSLLPRKLKGIAIATATAWAPSSPIEALETRASRTTRLISSAPML